MAKKILKAVVGLSIIILVHEAGHAIVALLAGIPIEGFSLGFGPGISIKIPYISELRLGVIFIGGYVKISPLAMAPWKEIILGLGGAAGNLIFSGVAYWQYKKETPGYAARWTLWVFSGALASKPTLRGGPKGFLWPWRLFKFLANSKKYFLQIIVLSIMVGAFNLLPFPLFDGFRLLTGLSKTLGLYGSGSFLRVAMLYAGYLILLRLSFAFIEKKLNPI